MEWFWTDHVLFQLTDGLEDGAARSDTLRFEARSRKNLIKALDGNDTGRHMPESESENHAGRAVKNVRF